jgi:hypothetical protein
LSAEPLQREGEEAGPTSKRGVSNSHQLLIHAPPSASNTTSIKRTLMNIACVRPGHPFSVV